MKWQVISKNVENDYSWKVLKAPSLAQLSQSPKFWTNNLEHSECAKDKNDVLPSGASMPACRSASSHPLWWDPCSWGSPSPIFECICLCVGRLIPTAETSSGGLVPPRMRIPIPEQICWATDWDSTTGGSKWNHLDTPPAEEYMHSRYIVLRVVAAIGSNLWCQTFRHARAWGGRRQRWRAREWSRSWARWWFDCYELLAPERQRLRFFLVARFASIKMWDEWRLHTVVDPGVHSERSCGSSWHADFKFKNSVLMCAMISMDVVRCCNYRRTSHIKHPILESIEILWCKVSNHIVIRFENVPMRDQQPSNIPPKPIHNHFTGPWKPQHWPSMSWVALHKRLQMESHPRGQYCGDTARLLWRSSKLLRAFRGTKPPNPWWRDAPNVPLCSRYVEWNWIMVTYLEVGHSNGALRGDCNTR